MSYHTVSRVLQGNEACAEAALRAGCRFFAGYPITPATEIAELMAAKLPDAGGVFMQMEDELASINALIGASWGGSMAMTATSGPGFSLMQEGIGYACMTQTPCVIVNVMRGGPSTGQPTMPSQQDVLQARYGSHGDYWLPVLAPSSAQESFDLTVRAFALAERLLSPVILLSDEIVAHTREKVLLPDTLPQQRRTPPPPGVRCNPFEPIAENGHVPWRPAFGEGHALLVEGQSHDVTGNRVGHLAAASATCLEHLRCKWKHNQGLLEDYQTEQMTDAEVVVLAYGSVARPALRAVREARARGVKAGLVRLRTLFPLPETLLTQLAERHLKWIMPEMNEGKLCGEVRSFMLQDVRSLPKHGGELHHPAEILEAILEA